MFSLSHVVVLPVMCLPVWYQCGYLEVAHSLDTSFNIPSYVCFRPTLLEIKRKVTSLMLRDYHVLTFKPQDAQLDS